MDSPKYQYDDEQQNIEYERRERKKKRHRKPKENEYNNDDDNYQNYEQPASPSAGYPRRSEEENFDPSQAPRRKHRSRPKRSEEDEDENGMISPEPSYDAVRKPKKERRKKQREPEEEDAYLNEPNGHDRSYPFEEATGSVQLDDDYGDEYRHDEPEDITEDAPDGPEEPAKPKKKSGGFMKIFASFKKKNKQKGSDPSLNGGKQWQSNPEIFNPAYDSQPGTLDRSKKTRGKSSRDLPFHKAHVILLDGVEVEFDTSSKMLGKELFDQVCSYLDLIEKDFFGMTYVNSKMQTWFWLEMEKKISKQLTSSDDWVFNFQVKFYPPEPVLLQEDITRYQLSLQVRQDVFTGKLPCSWITQALLGSFMVQSELGDYDELEHGEGIEYLHEFEFVLNQSDQLLEKIAELHKKHIGMPPDKADVKYLETAKRLEQYGVDLHPARDNDDVDIFIGVCYQGVLIYRERLRIGRFAWPKVLRISYKKNYFYLKIRSDRYDDSVAIVGFKLFNHNLAKRLWKNAVEQHTFFRMKEPQNFKQMPRMIPTTTSKFNYSGKTLHQYRSMNISRNEPLKFDRSVTKRRTIGSMPAGLESAGIQYSSMHSLNRSHPRDMTLGKTKSIEHLSSKRPASNIGYHSQREGSIGSLPQPNRYPPYQSHKDDDRHMSFQSGDSLNNADSYAVRNDDQVSLPPMPSLPQPEYTKSSKKPNSKPSRPQDVLSDDGIVSKPQKNRQSKPPIQNEDDSDEAQYKKPSKKQNLKLSRQPDDLSDDAVSPQPIYAKPQKKPSNRNSRHNDDLSDNDRSPDGQYGRPVVKKHSKTNRPQDIPDDYINLQSEHQRPSKKQSYQTPQYRDDLSDEDRTQDLEIGRPVKKHSSRNAAPKDNFPYEGSNYPSLQDRGHKSKNEKPISLPEPPVDTSQSEELDSQYRIAKKRSHQKPVSSNNAPGQSRPQPPSQFRPPPPPPEPIPHVRSNSSSERSSPMEHHLPPPPPPIVDIPTHVVEKPKPPPVKPKPAVKPKPKIMSKDQNAALPKSRNEFSHLQTNNESIYNM